MLSRLKLSNSLVVCFFQFQILILLVSTFFYGFKCGNEKVIPISTEEIVSFCEELESSILRFDPKPFNDALDIKRFRERVVDGLILKKGIRESMDQFIYQYQLGDYILNVVEKGEFIFEVTRIFKDSSGKQRAVFRLFNGDYLNYLEFEFSKIQNNLVIDKAYFYNTGRYLSQILNEYAHLVFGKAGNFVDDTERMNVLKVGYDQFQAAIVNLKYNYYEEAIECFNKIDPRIVDLPLFFPTHLAALLYLDENEFVKLLQRLNSKNPNEERFNLFNNIQISMIKGEVDETRKDIHFLSKYVGNDYALDYYEANALFNNEKYEKAVFYFDKFIEQSPELSFGYIGKIESFVKLENFEKASINVGRLVENFEVTFQEVEVIFMDYPKFLKSEELALVKKGLNSM